MNSIQNLLKTPFSSLILEENVQIKTLSRPTSQINLKLAVKGKNKQIVRTFNNDLFKKHLWLSGCDVLNAVFCFPCVLFSGETPWTKTGVTDLNHINEKIKKHANSAGHMNNVLNLAMLGTANIATMLDSAHRRTVAAHNEAVSKKDFLISFTADMKSPSTSSDDCDDIFGPPRTYPSGYYLPKNRPSMISPKYRQKEERRKVLKISIHKLKQIEDPEASLCRSVLINNTMKRLQKEARDEKLQKQQLNYPRCYDNENYVNLKSEFIKNESKHGSNYDESQSYHSEDKVHIDPFVVETEFEAQLAEELEEINAKNMELLGRLVEENLNDANDVHHSESLSTETAESNDRFSSRKRSFDDMDDCDVHDVLSQFYMPPTPRMLTSIDDDEDVNVVDEESQQKRAKVEALAPIEDPSNSASATPEMDKLDCDKTVSGYSLNNFLNNNIPTQDSRLRYLNANQTLDTDTNSFSCGHASMFNEFQSNVYHLVTSLET